MSLVLTLTQAFRAKYVQGGLDRNEIRRSRYGALRFYQEQTRLNTGLVSDDIKALVARSMGNTIQIPVLDAIDPVITNVRSCTVPDAENTSKLITLTFVTYAFGFTMIPAQYANNDIKYQQDFDRKLEQYLLKLAGTLDTGCVNNLNANKNIYWPAEVSAFYPVVGNALQVTQAQKNDLFNNLSAIQEIRDYYGATNIVAGTTLKPIINRLAAQGAGNSVNEDFQFNGYEWNFTNRMVNGAGVAATAFAVPDGMVAMLNRNDPDAIAGRKAGNGKTWDTQRMPIVDMDMALYYYDDCADKSALHAGTAHLTRTYMEGFEFSTDVCYVNAYNSNAAGKAGPILKIEVSAS